VYRTGDRARWLADGEIEFGGRLDFQVKLRGQRIELGEIEQTLCAQPGVVEAVVLMRTDIGEPTLVAYIAPSALVGAGSSEALPFDRVPALVAASSALPGYMLPTLVVGVDEWPRTPSDKLDRNRLPAPAVVGAAGAPPIGAAPPLAPRPDVAADFLPAVSEQARRSLKMAPDAALDVDAPLVQLGLNSLQAVLTVRALSERFETTLPATLAFDHPTARSLAGAVQARALGTAQPVGAASAAGEGASARAPPPSTTFRGREGSCLHWLTPPPPAAEEAAALAAALIFVHDFTGTLWGFRELARRAARPCLGFRCTVEAARGCADPHELALRYAGELRAALPAGCPARLVGYSFGCQVAHGMAQALEASGVVTRLAMLDWTTRCDLAEQRRQRVEFTIPQLRLGAASDAATVERVFEGSEHVARAFARLGAMLGEEGCAVAEALLSLELRQEVGRERVPPCRGPMVHVKTTGWDDRAPPCADVRLVAGDHFDFLLERAAEVTRILDGFFAEGGEGGCAAVEYEDSYDEHESMRHEL
jgi:thioesterase domain-containing protein